MASHPKPYVDSRSSQPGHTKGQAARKRAAAERDRDARLPPSRVVHDAQDKCPGSCNIHVRENTVWDGN
eukprot:gene22812-biopygen22263